MKLSAVSLSVALSFAAVGTALADDYVEQITIFGSQTAVDATPGSGAYIDQETLEDYAITDIMRVLASSPGVYVMEEDGYGLRPNIGMRGNSSDRSEKITIMEDGVLAAPAPYASPSAYYFPTVGRMSAVEVLKGSSSVKYGPRTSGGVINLVSTAIPDTSLAGKFDLAYGTDNYNKVHGVVGGKGQRVSSVFEVFHYGADGFKNLNSGQDTGFKKNDFMSKVEVQLDEFGKHTLELKLKYSDESSDETYLGLTDADYRSNSYQRYSASQLDNMDAEHKQVTLHYDFIITEDLDLSVIAYHNDFHRNWYKASKVGGNKLGKGAELSASLFDKTPTGTLDVDVKANNRDYLSQGIQAQLGYRTGDHDLNFGLRIHEDEMDRFQWVDNYDLNSDLSMTLSEAGLAGTDSNRIDSANALSLFIHDEYTLGDLTVSGGIRYEDVTIERDDWGKTNPARDTTASHKENSVSAFIPALGMTYQMNDDVIFLAGVQKSFAPPAPGNEDAKEEDGWNYEAGTRFGLGNWNGEVIAFYSKLDNLHGNCTASQGCDEDNIGEQYNAGAVDIKGLELTLSTSYSLGNVNIPVSFNYTNSDAEFNESFSSKLDSWGDVEAGDELPYLPEQVWQLESGVSGENWKILAAIKYVDDVRVSAGTEAINFDNGVKSHTLVDLSASYDISEQQQLYMVVDNLFDKEYVATRRHGGIQSGKPRTFQLGYRYSF